MLPPTLGEYLSVTSQHTVRALFIARNHWGVRTDCGPIAEVMALFTGMACKIFDRSKLVPCKNGLTERV